MLTTELFVSSTLYLFRMEVHFMYISLWLLATTHIETLTPIPCDPCPLRLGHGVSSRKLRSVHENRYATLTSRSRSITIET